MTNFLVKHFVKNYNDITSAQVRKQYGLLSSYVAICCNLLLFAVKLCLGLLSGSIAITADAFNNLSDVGSGVVTFLGFQMASRPADEDHPFGHGRYEYLSGLVIAVFILVVGVEVLKTSFEKIIHPAAVDFSLLMVFVLLLSILLKLWMSRFAGTLGNRIQSAAMKAAAADSISDCVSTGATTIGILIAYFFHLNIDGWLGLLVGVFILRAGIDIAKDTIDPLLGGRPNPELVKQIEEILMSYDGVLGVHDLVIHDYGPGRMMGSAHVEVHAESDMLETHDMIDNAERKIGATLHLPFVLHMDPIATESEDVKHLKEQVEQILITIDPALSLHDFRIVAGPSHTNLIFDLSIPYHLKLKHAELKKRIDEPLHKLGNYYTVITFDHSFI